MNFNKKEHDAFARTIAILEERALSPVTPVSNSLNSYSGKWNFECLDDDALVAQAVYSIERRVS